MYVTATSPYIFMLILLIRGAILEGSLQGVLYYLVPDFTKLADLTASTVSSLVMMYTDRCIRLNYFDQTPSNCTLTSRFTALASLAWFISFQILVLHAPVNLWPLSITWYISELYDVLDLVFLTGMGRRGDADLFLVFHSDGRSDGAW